MLPCRYVKFGWRWQGVSRRCSIGGQFDYDPMAASRCATPAYYSTPQTQFYSSTNWLILQGCCPNGITARARAFLRSSFAPPEILLPVIETDLPIYIGAHLNFSACLISSMNKRNRPGSDSRNYKDFNFRPISKTW